MKNVRNRWEKGKMLTKMGAGWLTALAACFMLFVFAPLEIYVSNPREFWYDAYLLFPFCLEMFAVFFLLIFVVFAVAYLCADVVYDLALAGGFTVFLGCYIQGNFLVKNLPPFDGTEIDWSLYRAEQIQSAFIWAAVFAVVLVLLGILRTQKFRRMVSGISVFLFLILFSTLCVLSIQGKLFEKKEFVKLTKENQFLMSTDTNFIILLLDAIDEKCFWEMWEKHPEYEEAMTDFTFFDNAMAGYPYTEYSMPLILSGEWYENKEPFEDYMLRTYGNAPVFERLESQGYQLNFYDDELQFEVGILDGRFQNMSYEKSSLYEPSLFMRRQIKMVGVKYAPYFLKPYCWFDPAKLWHQQLGADDKKLFIGKNRAFYEDVKKEEITYTEEKQFKFMHLMGAHVPFLYDQDVNEIEDADYYTCIESAMTVTAAYLEKLREAGVYDNSIILVLSDHGYNISGEAVRVPQRNEDSTGRQHPILFVKGLNERHPVQISGAPISYGDLAQAYNKLLDGESASAGFEYQEGDVRERRYLFHWFLGEDHLEEYVQTGYAGDENTLIPTGRIFDYGQFSDNRE